MSNASDSCFQAAAQWVRTYEDAPEDAPMELLRILWSDCRCDELPREVALVMLDTAVQLGVIHAISLLQNITNVARDGIVGPSTLRGVARLGSVRTADQLLNARLAVLKNMKIWPRFGKAWQHRIERLRFEYKDS